MKRFASAVVVTLLVAACGGGTSQPSPTPAPARTTAAPTAAPTATPAPTQAPTAVFTAELRSANEVPPITGAEASCTGTGTLTLDRVANSAKFDINATGCPAGAELTIAHIHNGPAGVVAGVVINPAFTAADLVLAGGAGVFTKTLATANAQTIADVIANPAGFYFNVHSKVNGGGVIRGQLVRRP